MPGAYDVNHYRIRKLPPLRSRHRSCKPAFLVPENAVCVWTEGKTERRKKILVAAASNKTFEKALSIFGSIALQLEKIYISLVL